jgi:hypothetical protein
LTVPSYTEDLTDIDLAANDTNWEESSASGWDTGGASTDDADYPYIQGGMAITQQCTKAAIAGLMVDAGSGLSLPADGAYFVWQFFASSTGLDTYANGGMRVMVGSDRANFKAWDVGGSDFARNPYGGWMNHAVNTGVSVDDTVGSPTATEQYIGAAVKSLAAIGKGNPHAVDAIRYGRGSSIFEYGEAANYCTFAGFAAQNDNSTYMWGLIQAIAGGFLYKGKMTLGTAGNACDFRDSNVSVLIDDTPKVTTNFNTIEVNNASSRVDWSNVFVTALGTASPGRLVCNANADLNWDGCQFTDMGAFTLGGTASEILNSIWNRCGLITVAGGKLNDSKILESSVAADASAVNWNVAVDPDGYLDDMTFSKGTNAHHAIEFGTSSPTTMTVRGMTSTGFNASNAQNDSTFYIARTSGTVTINVIGGTGNFSYKTAGATVVIVADPVTVAVHASDMEATDIENARVFLKAKDGTGPFPFEESVTIVNSGTTATVTHTAHGMASNDYADIKGASLAINNGAHQITVTGANTYTYTMSSSPGSSPTGTITSTFVALYGLTNASGDKSTSRVYASAQPVTGWVRLTPAYKTAPLFGEVSATTGYSATGVLISDE